MNLPTRIIAGFPSEVLVTGFACEDGGVALVGPDRKVPDGAKLF